MFAYFTFTSTLYTFIASVMKSDSCKSAQWNACFMYSVLMKQVYLIMFDLLVRSTEKGHRFMYP